MSSGMITFETFSRIYLGTEFVCCYEAYFEMIHSMWGYCPFLNLGMNQGCCYTVISTTEDFPNMFDDAMAFFFFSLRIIHIWNMVEDSIWFHHSLSCNFTSRLAPLVSAFWLGRAGYASV